jgi:putative DNA primase/helicase
MVARTMEPSEPRATRNGTQAAPAAKAPEPARDLKPVSYAAAYARRGYSVFLLHEIEADGHCSCGELECKSAGKHPRFSGWQESATTDEDQIRELWRQYPTANVGVKCGAESDLTVLDVDGDEGRETLRSLEIERGALPETPVAITGSGGAHYYFRFEEDLQNAVKFAPGLDVRTEGGLVVGVGSKTQRQYEWEIAFQISDDLKPARMRPWLVDLIRAAAAKSRSNGSFHVDEEIPAGQRNATLYKLGRSLRAKGLGEAAIGAALREENSAKCRPPLDRREVDEIITQILTQPNTKDFNGRPAAGDDLGLAQGDVLVAERFLVEHGQNVRFCPTRGWLLWDKCRWAFDDREQIVLLAEKTVRRFYREAANAKVGDARDALLKLARTYSRAERIRGMLTIARPHVAIIQDELDRDPFLLNCRNGTVDLRSGILLPHDRDNLISKIIDIEYLGDAAAAPRFQKFLNEIFNEKTELIEFVQRAVGHSFTGDQREQKVYFLYGAGANGKTTLVQIWLRAAGDYGHTAPAELLLARKFDDAIPTDRADLCGKRLVAVNETGEGRALAEALLKTLTGNDVITARHLYKNSFTFSPTHHIWLSSNHKPNVTGTDLGIWRRICLIPFTCKFEGEQDDKDLLTTLRKELPGILSWIVRGAVAWFQEGRLQPPEAVTAATSEYRAEQDVLAEFLGDCCLVDPRVEVGAKALYARYLRWAEEAGEKHPLTHTMFGRRLSDCGFPADRSDHTKSAVRHGLALRPE